MEDNSSHMLLKLLAERVEEFGSKLDRLDARLDSHMVKEEKDKEQQMKDIAELKETFNAAKVAITVVKWGAALIGAIALSWAFIKDHFTIGIK